jgi:hypothetical protein
MLLRKSAMRIDHRVPALVLAVMLGTLIGCQRKDYPLPSSDMAVPSRQDERAGAPVRPDGDDAARPGRRGALGPKPFVHPDVPPSFWRYHQWPPATRGDRVEA